MSPNLSGLLRSSAPRRIATLLQFSLFVALSLLLMRADAQAGDELPRGQVIEKVACRADSSQSYALYLPSAWTPGTHLPILYCFDPGARGKVPVELFSEAAEKYGWIVVGSNNSRNGPNVPLNSIIATLWQDTRERFAPDERRAYTAGFSGGARVASSFAIASKGGIAGVIACGAGFPYAHTPEKDDRFAFLGIAGLEDFNLIELHELEPALEKAGFTHQLITFDGNHAWPPKAVCTEAVEWMEAQSFKAGLRARDEKLIADLYAAGLARARLFEQDARLYDAWLRYQSLAESFRGLREVSEAGQQAQRLKAAKEVKAAVRQLKEMDQQQNLRAREFFTTFESMRSADLRTQGLSDLRRMIADLRKQSEAQQQSGERTVARRLLTQFFIASSEGATQDLFQKDFAQAALRLSIAAEIRPDNPQVHYRLAAASAQSGNRKQAIESLRRAIAAGFNDLSRLAQAPEFSSLYDDREFKSLLEQKKQ